MNKKSFHSGYLYQALIARVRWGERCPRPSLETAQISSLLQWARSFRNERKLSLRSASAGIQLVWGSQFLFCPSLMRWIDRGLVHPWVPEVAVEQHVFMWIPWRRQVRRRCRRWHRNRYFWVRKETRLPNWQYLSLQSSTKLIYFYINVLVNR